MRNCKNCWGIKTCGTRHHEDDYCQSELCTAAPAYGHAQALFGMGFDVKAGEVVTLLGRNGMGRSTRIKCLFGMLPVKSGAITFGGKSLTSMSAHGIARLGLGLVPEGRQIFPSLSVEENLIATARVPRHGQVSLKPWDVDRVYRFFTRLKERRGNHGWQLSGADHPCRDLGRAGRVETGRIGADRDQQECRGHCSSWRPSLRHGKGQGGVAGRLCPASSRARNCSTIHGGFMSHSQLVLHNYFRSSSAYRVRITLHLKSAQ
ncbi:ATP-binding cassette domain-containing protein [Janthinobacterium sp. HLX7-2]|uniref:ATP-binding cassette domain-containing protein n=1 Tax=Janthinobacterium sp. HLX7-2 TaxID=1259331 RepID=UPI003F278F7A